jgi:hypothetical protein
MRKSQMHKPAPLSRIARLGGPRSRPPNRARCRATKHAEPQEVLTSEQYSQWQSCKDKLIAMGVEKDETERILRESFAWNGHKYWEAEERVRGSAVPCNA